MLIAITRAVSPAMQACELTHLERLPIDLDLAQAQHQAYQRSLAALGCRLIELPAEPDLPDSVFVEDTAIVLDEVAVITRPGALSRRPETAAIQATLQAYRPIFTITAPGILDGGDVLQVDKQIFVGLSSRSNPAAVAQLQQILGRFGYNVTGIQVQGCLHLKSAVTRVGVDSLLLNPAWVDENIFDAYQKLHVAPGEPMAANGLLLNQTLIYPSTFPETRRRLEAHGVPVQRVEISELAKAEGAVTCCSLILRG